MRKPRPDGAPADDTPTPEGGRALDRAKQFAKSRGLPLPGADPAQNETAAKSSPPAVTPQEKPGKR